MNWFYALGGQQQGPVDDNELDRLIAAGTLTAETLVWREGMGAWQPLRVARPGSAAAPASGLPPVIIEAPPMAGPGPAPGEVTCAECGRFFPRDNTIQYGTAFVCANCKPIFVQRLQEGSPIPRGTGASVTEEQLLAREYRVEIGECIERGWKTYGDNVGLIIGASLVMVVVAAVFWVISAVVGSVVPGLNFLLSFAYSGPLVGGYLWFMLRLARGEPASVGDAFVGFSRHGLQLMLSSLVQGLLNVACFLPLIIMGGVAGFTFVNPRGGPPQMNMDPAIIMGLVLMGLTGGAAVAYLNTLWLHSLLLVMDKGYSFWRAMHLSRRVVSQRFWMTLLFLIVGSLLSGAGILACGVGLLVSVPLYYGMKVCLYDENFRDLEHFNERPMV